MAAGSGQVLSQLALNRALLARQGLLARFDATIPQTLDLVGGIQAQYAPAMYVGLWSRMAGLTRSDLTAALEDRSVVQGTLLRSTIHLVSRADYWPTTLAIRRVRREWHLRVIKNDPPESRWHAAAGQLRRALADGPMRRRDIDTLIGAPTRSAISLWLDLVRVPPSGTWERRCADLFALAEDWVGPVAGTEADGVALLVGRYLQGFGPARTAEIANWAGLPVEMINAACQRIELRHFLDEAGKTLIDLPDLPLPAPETAAPVRFLPTWDATLLVHARRTQILPEEHRTKIFSAKNPHSVGTFLVDGAVAGTWRYAGGQITVEAFQPMRRSLEREIADEADRLAAFHR